MDFKESLLRQNECKVGMVAFERKIFVAIFLLVRTYYNDIKENSCKMLNLLDHVIS